MAVFADKELVCKDCNEKFIFSARQQEHHASLGLRNEPKRCMVCRQAARMRKDDRIASGRPFGSGRPRPGGPPPPRRFDGPGGGFGGPPRPRETFIATCAQCGKETDLPFKPRGDRPVYCRACFTARK